jgi:hypothetical protein
MRLCGRLFSIPALLAFTLVALPTGFAEAQGEGNGNGFFNEHANEAARNATPDHRRKYLVELRSRVFEPGLGKPIQVQGSRAEVYVQFERPLKASERGALKRTGIRFYAVVSSNTYLVKVKSAALNGLRRHPLIGGIEPVEPADKLTANLYHGTVGGHALNENGTWSVVVRFYEDVSLEAALASLDERGIRVPDRSQLLFNERLAVEATQGQLLDLSADPNVREMEEISPPPTTHNTTAQAISNVNVVQAAPFNLDGSGVVMGIWDGGNVLTTHADLTGRVTLVHNTSANDHATHVAGTMLSSGANNATAEGMAPRAGQLYSYNFNGNPVTEQRNAVRGREIVISNHSWGAVLGWNFNGANWVQTGNNNLFGAYNGTAAAWDDLVADTGLIAVKAAGNDGTDCNPNPPFNCDGITGTDGQRYDIVAFRGVAKNIITVGALQDNGTTNIGFSSTGPADDGRIKPDVVANGQTLTSTWAGGVTINLCPGAQYCPISGTSMATPTVSGLTALLVERYRDKLGSRPQNDPDDPSRPLAGVGGDPSPDIVKALLVNTAQDLGRVGPDYIYGHGLADAQAAVNTIDMGGVRILTEAVDQGEFDEYALTVPAGAPPLRVTLAWTDPQGAANSAANDLINNLDVELIAPDGTSFFPWTGPGTGAANVANNATNTGANNIDNVEHVDVPNPAQGFWTIRVDGTTVPSGPQNYALVANQTFSLEDQPDIRVNAPLDFDEICTDGFQDIRASIFNTGGADLLVNSVSVIAGAADFSVLPNPTQPFVVRPGAHVDVTVRFAPTSPGLKTGTLRIESNDADTPTFDIPMTGDGGTGDVNATLEADGDFGNVALGSFGVLTLQLLNQGTCNLEITNVVRIAGGTDFSLGGIPGLGLPRFPLILSPDAHADMPLRFKPTVFGVQNATFRVTTNDPDTPTIDVNVTGNSPPSDIRVSGSSDFGVVCAEELAEQEIDICNVGLSDLVVGTVGFDPPCNDFTLVNNPFPANVSHDFCMPLTIRYTPAAAGDHSCTLKIPTNDPDSPVVSVGVAGSTPLASIDVPPDVGFPATVIQSIGACSSREPFPISNTGVCPLEIEDVSISGAAAGEYALSGLPSFPILLDSGHVAGDGDLEIAFAPEVLDRAREADLSVRYVSDPITGSTLTTTRDLCGEGVHTGARVLVTVGGTPPANVDRIQIQRINANRNRPQLDTVDVERNVTLKTETPPAPCASFQYHKEYGTLANPVQLLPGSYQVNVTATVNGKKRKKSVGFDVSTCDFNPTVIVEF